MRRDDSTLIQTSMYSVNFARRGAALLSLAALLAPPAHAQQASERPQARPLGAALATSEPMSAISAVRQLPGGRLLVNDPARRRVVMLDSMMKTIAVVADTTPATQNAYGVRGGGILPWRGDSTLFLDPASLSMLVLDPNGMITRVMAAPRPDDVFSLVGGALGYPGFDANGRLIYRSTGLNFNRRNIGGGGGGGGGGGAGFQPPTFPDSTPLVRFDLAMRKLDTAAFIKVAAPRIAFLENEGRRQLSLTVNPLPEVDDWAVLSDGTIAILRKDYHVDFVDASGQKTSGPKIPFDWQRLNDSAKSAIIDSAKARMARARAAGPGGGFVISRDGPGGNDVVSGGGPGGPGGAPVMVFRTERAEGGPPPRGGAPTETRAAGPPALTFVEPSELPDYHPAFAVGSVRADREGKLWVRTISAAPSTTGPEYDVIDRTGRLVDRVALPSGTTIAGFGADGTVYLGVRDSSGVHIARARER